MADTKHNKPGKKIDPNAVKEPSKDNKCNSGAMDKENKTWRERNNLDLPTIINMTIAGAAVIGMFFTGVSGCYSYKYYNEFKKQFALENEPILQVIPNFPNNDSDFIIIPNLINYGKRPVFIRTLNYGMQLMSKTGMTIEEIKSDTFSQKVNILLPFDKPQSVQQKKIGNLKLVMIKNKEFPVFFWGYITYQNIITKQMKDYTFKLKISYNENGYTYVYDINKNDTLK